jgi:uncharacterized protein
MSLFRWVGWFAALCAVVTTDTARAAPAADLHDATQTYEAYLADQSRGYDEVNAAYRAALLAAPDDARLAVARCEFISNFLYAEDINWSERAEEDSTECMEELRGRWPDAPEVQVYLLENSNGDDALAEGATLWKSAAAWPKPLRARLASRLHSLHTGAAAHRQAGRFALTAVRLGDASLLPEAIAHLAANGKPAEAIALADAAAPATASWIAVQRILALGELADKSAALRELNRSESADVAIPAAIKLRVYLDAGDLSKARKVSKDIADDADDKQSRAAMFDLALAIGKPARAASWVSLTQDELDVAMQRYVDVLRRAPQLAFSSSLLPLTLVALLIVAMSVLLPGLLLMPVHYRGLMRRTRGRAPLPMFERIGLRHAWMGTAVFFVVPLVMACIVRPDLIGTIFSGNDGREMFSDFSVIAMGTAAGLLLLSPWLRSLGWQHLLGERRHVVRTLVMVMLCWIGVFAVSAGIVWVTHLLGIDDTSTAQTETIDALVQNSQATYGLLATLLLMAVAVPLLEELIFRGMLLGGMSRHISFGWANALQALLFATIHFDPPRFLFYLALGLTTGWLVRRHHSLWPALLLHALNNGLAVFMQLA